jgi:thymidylate synthase (FAD)
MFKNSIQVLDHGFVALRNLAGPTRRVMTDGGGADWEGFCEFDADDTDPANAARMSFDQTDAGRTREQDLKLASYLMRNKHTSPFEMIEVWLEMKLPIFVARQFVRHRTVSLNEVSGRYVKLPAEWYVPTVVGGKAASAKQGQQDNLSDDEQQAFRQALDAHCGRGYAHYETALAAGVAPEHARMMLSLNHYTHWLWKQNLHNLMHFLSLRDHSHAQVEAQMYAKAIDTLIRTWLPETMKLYDQFRRLPD